MIITYMSYNITILKMIKLHNQSHFPGHFCFEIKKLKFIQTMTDLFLFYAAYIQTICETMIINVRHYMLKITYNSGCIIIMILITTEYKY